MRPTRAHARAAPPPRASRLPRGCCSELYTPENAFIESGALVLRTRLQNISWDGIAFNVTSGRVDTFDKVNITFGRIEVSAQLQNDGASGIHTAHCELRPPRCAPKKARHAYSALPPTHTHARARARTHAHQGCLATVAGPSRRKSTSWSVNPPTTRTAHQTGTA